MSGTPSYPITLELGDVRVDVVSLGGLKLDGGAMFGVVPKPLWSRVVDVDERNRIPLGLNSLVIRNGRDVVLVDTGMGERWSDKERDIYGIETEPGVECALESVGLGVEDVTIVLNTHLHFDHAGGNTVERGGELVPRFPTARYIVQSGELAWAQSPTLRDRASYVPETFQPVVDAGRFETVDGDVEVIPGVSVRRVPGHTPNIHAVMVRGGGRTLFFPSDLVPMAPHLSFAWVMGYDLEPLRTLENKIAALEEAAREGWLVVLEHEPIDVLGRVVIEEKRVRLAAL